MGRGSRRRIVPTQGLLFVEEPAADGAPLRDNRLDGVRQMVKPDRAVYTPTDFVSWREAKSLVLTPKFQRRGVWKPAARSFFIDTLLRGMPVPPIYIRVTQSADAKRVVREVIDGQQRIASILDFMDGKYRLSKTLSAPWRNQNFESLGDLRNKLRSYGFSAEVFHDVSDQDILELFARLNLYSVKLNGQELRNGKFFGLFKQSAYSLALEHLEFWRRNRIFTETNIARMLEAELTSELMIASMEGMQDKKKSIDDFYDRFDETFTGQSTTEKRFRAVMDAIGETADGYLADTEFRRAPLFYTLWCVVYHRIYGLPEEAVAVGKRSFGRDERETLRDALVTLSERIAAARSGEGVPARFQTFVNACLRQTDNLRPRSVRFVTLYNTAFE
jgi:hypothetical protein